MKTLVALGLVVAFAMGAINVPAIAGEHKKCTYTTQECLNYMAEHYKTRGWCGIELDVNEETEVMTVTRVVPGSPAEAGGFMVGDVLLGFNGVLFADRDEAAMKEAKKGMTIGAEVAYIVERNGERTEVPVTLAEVPEDVLAAWIGQHMLEHVEVASASSE